MKSKYLLNISIGPVQELIAEARKTRDLWVGSYLLSRVTFEAMRPFIEDSEVDLNNIIYPALERSPFYQKFYKKGENPDRKEIKVASLPNHFLVIVPENNLDSLIKESKNMLETYWNSIAESVRQHIKSELDSVFKGWDSQWEFQVCDLWQYMWVALPVTDKDIIESYQEKAKQIQRLLEERKLTRTFGQWQGSTAIKCVQCGHREAIGPVKLDKISGFWEYFRVKFRTNIRKSDRLCAICTIKRFVKSSDILDGLDEIRFESTRDIAVIPFREFILNRKDEFDEKISNLIDKVTELKNSITSYRSMTIRSIRDIGGDFLYKDALTPEKLLKEYFPELKEGSPRYNTKKISLK